MENQLLVIIGVIVCCDRGRCGAGMEAGLNTVMVSFHSIHIGE